MLVYATDAGQRTVRITTGVPQSSTLGPTLWNRMCNGVLRLKLSKGVEIVGFADDVVLTVAGESCEEAEIIAAEAIRTVENWMQEAKLQIDHHKTKLKLISNCIAVR